MPLAAARIFSLSFFFFLEMVSSVSDSPNKQIGYILRYMRTVPKNLYTTLGARIV